MLKGSEMKKNPKEKIDIQRFIKVMERFDKASKKLEQRIKNANRNIQAR
tara:strand:- start:1105 stop:1251 length:147 start_codon:yes stop_codon:yes gene_type:complete